jgi:hypothetical protein
MPTLERPRKYPEEVKKKRKMEERERKRRLSKKKKINSDKIGIY